MKTLRTNYLGKYLEQYPKVSIKSILQSVEFKIKEEILNIELEGIEIIKTSANYGWFRIWFKCPKCNKKVFNLYDISWKFICRKCSWLKYKKQRFKGMIEGK